MLLQVEAWPELRRWAETAEAQGWDDIWVADHMSNIPGRPYLECWALLGALAVVTKRVRLGPLVASITLRGPAALAKHAVAVDRISGGRLELGIGAGGAERDYHPNGLVPWSPRERQDRLEETVEAVDRLLRGAGTDHIGPHYSLTGAEMLPGPVQSPRPPITIAAHGPRGLRLVARFAQGWNTLGRGGGPDERLPERLAATRRQIEGLQLACAEAGRPLAAIRRSVLLNWPTIDPFSSTGAFEELIGSYAELGLDEFILYWPFEPEHRSAREAVIERIAAEVLPRLRDNRG